MPVLRVAILTLALSEFSCSAQISSSTSKPPSDLGTVGLRHYYKGQADARADIAQNRLYIQASAAFGAPSPAYEKLLRDRYKIEVEIVSTDEMSDEQYGYKTGYNSISIPEIEGRYGKGVLDRAYAESERKSNAH